MKEIYIMLTQVGTLVSKSIKLYTKSKYNHSSIGVDPRILVFYSFARRVRYFPLIGGFVTEVINDGMFKLHPETECAIYALQVNDDVYDNVCKVLYEYQINSQKYRYNLLGLVGILINRPISSKNKCTCSEFVARTLSEAGIYKFTKHFSLTKPEDMLQIPGLRLVYEGKMQHFNYQKKVS